MSKRSNGILYEVIAIFAKVLFQLGYSKKHKLAHFLTIPFTVFLLHWHPVNVTFWEVSSRFSTHACGLLNF